LLIINVLDSESGKIFGVLATERVSKYI